MSHPHQKGKWLIMNLREQKGLQIAALSKIKRKGGFYIVPSQSGKGQYKVQAAPDLDSCTCPDFKANRVKCKHIFAVEFTIQRETSSVQPRQATDAPLRAKIVYKQNWPAYRLAQIYEKARFQELLYGLCSGIDEPIQLVGRWLAQKIS